METKKTKVMSIEECFEEIMLYCHWRNWLPDWIIVQKIYQSFPDSYSILTPFAYAYFEELIRSTTSEYGMTAFDRETRQPIKKRKTSNQLIDLSIKENDGNEALVCLLEQMRSYYKNSDASDNGDNRHSTAHGYMHPRFWSKESFEQLIRDIASLSKHSGQ